eukprot:50125-Eustigmatos_ZCMA.PRE.1
MMHTRLHTQVKYGFHDLLLEHDPVLAPMTRTKTHSLPRCAAHVVCASEHTCFRTYNISVHVCFAWGRGCIHVAIELYMSLVCSCSVSYAGLLVWNGV